MISIYLREQKRYTQENLVNIFPCSSDKTIHILKRLKEYGVLKSVKATDIQKNLTDLVEEDIEVFDINSGEDEYLFVFTFVGIIVIDGILLMCYPKYILNTNQPRDELKQILKVLEKYNSKDQIIRMYNGANEGHTFNSLAIILFLLQDYYEYGTYTNTQNIVEYNGSGDILWDKTINDTFMLISNNRPYYPEFLTKKRINNDSDYFKRLHECILTHCTKELGDDLLDLFDILGVDISDETIEDFGDNEYILERIIKELNSQFNTHKQLLLKAIYAYIANKNTLNNSDCFSTFGTNSFNLIWEKVCSDVMDNQLQCPLGILHLPIPLADEYIQLKKQKLIEIIEKPKWYGISNEKYFVKESEDTLIPDIVTITNHKSEYKFIIFDAKYYNLQLENDKKINGQPGIESIIKQYMYQLAYQHFIEVHKIPTVKNCFLFPSDGDKIINKGKVTLNMLNNLNLNEIMLRLLPAKVVYKHYINNTKFDINLLNL